VNEIADNNADFSRPVRVETRDADWQGSPSGSVWRKPLYREGGEHGPVTSVVRYDAGGSFAPHAHPQGEEILVLSGVFADDQGEYPAGTFLFNPDGSRHAPRSPSGCELLVRLRQSPGPGRPRQRVDTAALPPRPGCCPGTQVREVWNQESQPQSTWLVTLEPGFRADQSLDAGGLEVFVLQGVVTDELGRHGPGTWVRWPSAASHRPRSEAGAQLFLRYAEPPPPGTQRLVGAPAGADGSATAQQLPDSGPIIQGVARK
jgi:anti-sigma factor ChrR (cupin superfamily)